MGLKLLFILQINSSYSSKKLLKSDGSVTWNNLHHNIFIISKFKKFLKTYLTSKYEQCLKISTAISILHRLVPYFINQENTVYLLFPFFLFFFFFSLALSKIKFCCILNILFHHNYPHVATVLMATLNYFVYLGDIC